jgi:hypothetical protein
METKRRSRPRTENLSTNSLGRCRRISPSPPLAIQLSSPHLSVDLLYPIPHNCFWRHRHGCRWGAPWMGPKLVGLRRQKGRRGRALYPGLGAHPPGPSSGLRLPHRGTHPRFSIRGMLFLKWTFVVLVLPLEFLA